MSSLFSGITLGVLVALLSQHPPPATDVDVGYDYVTAGDQDTSVVLPRRFVDLAEVNGSDLAWVRPPYHDWSRTGYPGYGNGRTEQPSHKAVGSYSVGNR